MNGKTLATGGLVAGLFLIFTMSVSAEHVRLFGPPERGHARPPLWVSSQKTVRPESFNNSTNAPYTPAQVQHAYGFDMLSATGTGQTIAIIDAYDDSQYIQNDLNTFCSKFGIASTTVSIIYAQGSKPSGNSGWQQETSLDVEWAHAMAPGAKILLVEAATSSYANLLQAVQVAVNNGATVVSMSWGGSEFAGETSYDSYFSASGVTFVASSGDSGESTGVEWPAASPNVVAVGGTTLILNSAGGYGSETAWASSGGGISVYEAQPVWQNGWFQTAWTPPNRGVPDVAYLADPNYGVYVVYRGSWYEFGGTSVGAPQWAALIARANQGRTSPLPANQASYALADAGGTTAYGGYTVNSTLFHDTTSGSNGSYQDDFSYAGYDLVTGVGTPMAASLVPALKAWGSTPPSPDFGIAVSPGSRTVAPGGATSYAVTVSSLGGYGGTVNLSVSGLPGNTTGNFSPASVSGSGSPTLNIQTSSSTPTGTYTLTITGTDTTGSPTHSVNATLVVANVAASMSVSSISYATSGGHHSTLNVTLAVANNLGKPVANASVAITLTLNGSTYATGTGTTGSNGQITFSLRNAPAGTYSTVVTSVTASGLTWTGNYPSNSYSDPY